MDIDVVSSIPYPIDAVFTAMRDQLPALADYMPNVDRVEVLEQSEPEPGVMKLLNKWHTARTEIPAIARPFVDQSKMYWFDHATWIEAERLCRWRNEVGFMAERVDCAGATRYRAVKPDVTELHIQGRLTIDLEGLVPRLMLKKATSGVEAFVGRLIEPNFQKTAAALTRYLDAQGQGA